MPPDFFSANNTRFSRNSLQCLQGNSASILITTLWTLIILAIIAVSLAKGAFSTVKFADYLKTRVVAHYLARAGLKKAIQKIIDDKVKESDSLNEPWTNNSKEFEKVQLGAGVFSVSFESENGKNIYGAIDEERKLNVNRASLPALSRLLQLLSQTTAFQADEIAAAIIDWRDKDDKITKGEAEDNYYRNLHPPYKCKNSDIESIEEILLIKGVTDEILNSIRAYITIFGHGAVNINTAGKTVLEALGMEPYLASKIVNIRKGGDGIIGTEDDIVFKNPSKILSDLSSRINLTKKEKQTASSIVGKGLLSTVSDSYRISSYGHLNSDDSKRSIEAVIDRGRKDDIRIVYWHEE